eukprot:SAG11_NODE_5817_length_1457_cov_1.254050_1_plen_64_part_01
MVEVTVALRSSKLLKLHTKLGTQSTRLEIAQIKAKGKPTKRVTSLTKTVERLTDTIEELKTAPS